MHQTGKLTQDPPSLGSLSPSLLTSFGSLSTGARKLFLRLYRAVWNHLVPFSRLMDAAHLWDLPSLLSGLSPSISVHSFFMLSRLWLLTGAGASSVDVRALGLSSSEVKQVSMLVRSSLVSRSYFDPLHPHLSAFRSRQIVFISLTPAGITFYKLVLQALRDRSRADLLNYLRYQHKKGQTV
jgi:hypothetical protein